MGWLEGKIALVTGGGSGIGHAVVERYIAEGAKVGVMDWRADRLEDLKVTFGNSIEGIPGDVTNLADNKRAVDQTTNAFGRLDIFVGNAGIFDSNTPFEDFPEDKLSAAFDELFGVNVKGCLLGAKAALPELLKSEGCMIFTASVAGFNSAGGGAMYTASKHAVVGLIRELAAELAPRVRVAGVAPGGVVTDLRGLETTEQNQVGQFSAPDIDEILADRTPMKFAMHPKDMAGAYVLLASKEYGLGITGSVITVDGGALLRQPRPRPVVNPGT
ncbi:3-(cis-5,6-dihydroxycyclohexa-1,3-dien-1-yl)propanoate dehydrogenase [SAR202 cluster bacterium AD-804-J14_MRT_500m]|nr:3-(cis-5,6-dihydroxycyclohexa-1,3-dien-1-yl)propanoate dehydrogenase [SAR202 cluster bacterium AD-804-J14_MRT_500m]